MKMETPEKQCERLKTEMLDVVFELMYYTFWTPRYQKRWRAEHLASLQGAVQQFAAVLFRAPESDGSSPQQVMECIEHLRQEVDRLYGERCITREQYEEGLEKFQELQELMTQIPCSCLEK